MSADGPRLALNASRSPREVEGVGHAALASKARAALGFALLRVKGERWSKYGPSPTSRRWASRRLASFPHRRAEFGPGLRLPTILYDAGS